MTASAVVGGGRRVLWTIVVLALLAMAGAAVAKIVREQSAAGATAPAAAPPAAGGEQVEVTMAGLTFHPASRAVRPGSAVLFRNDDSAPHTVTADGGGTDSGVLGPGRSFRLVVRAPFTYHCAIHPGMKARIVLSG